MHFWPALRSVFRWRLAPRAQPAMDLPRRAREAELTQLAPQRHRVLAAGREPRLKMGEVRIQNAATGCLGGALREALGLGELADRPAGQPHATADSEQ